MTKEEQIIFDYVSANYRKVVMGRAHRTTECGAPYISYDVVSPTVSEIPDYFRACVRLPEGGTVHWRAKPSVYQRGDGVARLHIRFAVT